MALRNASTGQSKKEFFGIALRQKLYTSVEELQKDLDKWLKRYNDERPRQGYRNMRRRPIETIEAFKRQGSNYTQRRLIIQVNNSEIYYIFKRLYSDYDILLHIIKYFLDNIGLCIPCIGITDKNSILFMRLCPH